MSARQPVDSFMNYRSAVFCGRWLMSTNRVLASDDRRGFRQDLCQRANRRPIAV